MWVLIALCINKAGTLQTSSLSFKTVLVQCYSFRNHGMLLLLLLLPFIVALLQSFSCTSSMHTSSNNSPPNTMLLPSSNVWVILDPRLRGTNFELKLIPSEIEYSLVVFPQVKEISLAADNGVWPEKLAAYGFASYASKKCTKSQLLASTAWNKGVRPLLASFNKIII